MWAKFELECQLRISIYFNSNFKVTCKNEGFKCLFFKSHFEERILEFVLYHSPLYFALFLIKIVNLLASLNSLESTFCNKITKHVSKWFILTPQNNNNSNNNSKCKVHQSKACFLNTIHLGILGALISLVSATKWLQLIVKLNFVLISPNLWRVKWAAKLRKTELEAIIVFSLNQTYWCQVLFKVM